MVAHMLCARVYIGADGERMSSVDVPWMSSVDVHCGCPPWMSSVDVHRGCPKMGRYGEVSDLLLIYFFLVALSQQPFF